VTKVYEVKSGCPICHGDVKGNDQYRYFCKNCNLLFNRTDLKPSMPEGAAKKPSQEVASAFEAGPMVGKKYLKYKYVCSKKGKLYHVVSCRGGTSIHKKNRVYFHTRKEAEALKYKPAECVKKCIKAKE
jgi:hypothetical protein